MPATFIADKKGNFKPEQILEKFQEMP